MMSARFTKTLITPKGICAFLTYNESNNSLYFSQSTDISETNIQFELKKV